jgi:hypothetical protein
MKKCSLIPLIACLLLLGNHAYGQWTQAKGPSGGTVLSIAASGNTIFAGTFRSGVFRSIDNGASWTAVNSGLTDLAVPALSVSGGTIFAGTTVDVFISTNTGASWVSAGLPNNGVNALATSGSNVFVGAANGLFLSTNNGISWISADFPMYWNNNGYILGIYAFAVSGSAVFAGASSFVSEGGNVVFLSNDNGITWTAADSGLRDTTFNSLYPIEEDVYALAVSHENIFAGTNRGVFLSTDSGASWRAVNSGLTDAIVSSFAVSGGNIFAGTFGSGVFISTNTGTSWTDVNTGLMNSKIRSLAVHGNHLFAGTDGDGIWRRPLSEMIEQVNALPQQEINIHMHLNVSSISHNGSTIAVELYMPHPGMVAISLHNLAGRETASFVNNHLDAGSYRYCLDTHTLMAAMRYGCMRA